MTAPPPSCFAMCSAVPHVNAFEDLFEEDSDRVAALPALLCLSHVGQLARLDRERGSSSSENDGSDTGLDSDNTSEVTASGEDEEDEQHEQVFDIERLRWENREEQRLEQLLADAGRGGPFRRLSELRMAIDDAEMVGVPQAKLEAARRVLRSRSGASKGGTYAWPDPAGGLHCVGNVHRMRALPTR
mmetsp:Transcript_61306/g.182618  ORF Transcript_61306/g.182618 Transcript_61306/m.182618 type:complete len:187 (-) Transcript_61306:136-696(-)